MSVVIAIFLAVLTLITAGLGILDLKTFREDAPSGEKPVGKHLSWWGVAKILCALATFALVGFNEVLKDWASQTAQEQEKSLRAQITELQTAAKISDIKLDNARKGMETTLRKTELIERSTRGQMVRVGTYYLSFSSEEPEVLLPLLSRSNEPYIPKQGDEISWTFYCRSGAVPELTQATRPTGCDDISYGSLIANSQARPVSNAQSSFVYRGTQKTGGNMVFQAPLQQCRPLLVEMRKRLCELEVRVDRSAGAQRFEILRADGFSFAGVAGDPLTGDLCAAYDLLYNKTCEQLLTELNQRR